MYAAIAWGRRLLGKVDRVPGEFHVAIQFWMFCYLPLVPLNTWLITFEKRHGMRGTFRGVIIPFSFKSYTVAWMRSILGGLFTVLAIASITITCIYFSEVNDSNPRIKPHSVPVLLAITAVVGILLFAPYWIPGIGRATPARAAQLRAMLPKGIGVAVMPTVFANVTNIKY